MESKWTEDASGYGPEWVGIVNAHRSMIEQGHGDNTSRAILAMETHRKALKKVAEAAEAYREYMKREGVGVKEGPSPAEELDAALAEMGRR
jgi:hypothetical protein